MLNFDQLVFEGGGMKGAAYARVPEILEEYGILKNIKKVAGSSAGSIAATLIALKYPPDEIRDLICNLKFTKFKDVGTYTYQVIKILTSYGIHSGDYFTNWIQCRIRMQTGSRYTTFRELKELNDIELVITGTNLRTGATEYFSYKTTPNMQIWQAVRISITIPIFFTPISYNNDLYIDGGVLSNYPIWIFDDPDSYEYNPKLSKYAGHTLGFRLFCNHIDNRNDNPYIIPSVSMIIRTIGLLLNNVASNPEYSMASTRTVNINTTGVKSTEFNVSEDLIEMIIENGYDQTKKYLDIKTSLENINDLSDSSDDYPMNFHEYSGDNIMPPKGRVP